LTENEAVPNNEPVICEPLMMEAVIWVVFRELDRATNLLENEADEAMKDEETASPDTMSA
jgi:hypothetical protein